MINFFRFLRNIGLIVSNKKWLTLFTYLKLKLIRKKNKVRILNFNLNFLNYDIVITLFEDLFIENEYFTKIKKNKPSIINVGANIGLATMYFRYIYPEAQILAFEPDPVSFKVLKRNVEENNFREIRLINAAVSNKNKKAKFYFDPNNQGALLMSLDKKRLLDSKPIYIKAVRLSDYIKEIVDLVKIDVEGEEQKIIEDLSASKKIKFINQLIIEYHHHIRVSKDNLSLILRLLENNNFGYQIVTKLRSPINYKNYQDILIYAYNKNKKNN